MNEHYKILDKKIKEVKALSIANKDRQMIIDKLVAEGRVKDRLIESLKLEIRDLRDDIRELMYAKKRALNRIEGE
ncbi:hypothetical protein ES708_16970 [subsurface metagenome]